MKCEIISVGTEILLGDIVNTNAQYLSQKLAELGVDVFYTIAVGDNYKRIYDVVKTSIERSDMVITTGGLGPTDDDITKEVVADAMGFELVMDEYSKEKLYSTFKKMNVEMPICNLKQAMMPKDGMILENHNGTAPACIMEKNGKIAVVLPGPPKEMKPLFEEQVEPFLKSKTQGVLKSKTLKILGVGESTIQELLKDIFDHQTNPSIAPYAKETGTQLRITAKTNTVEEADELIEEMYHKVKAILGEHIFSDNEDFIEDVVIKGLKSKGLTISLAESCTGGLATAQLINVAGASDVVMDSIITYSNQAKVKFLGVNEETLEKFGAVSPETAIEMAQGIRKVSKTNIGIGITGVAGPDGGTAEKPVGLVFIAIADEEGAEVKQYNLNGNRARIRQSAAVRALDFMRRELL